MDIKPCWVVHGDGKCREEDNERAHTSSELKVLYGFTCEVTVIGKTKCLKKVLF